MTATHHDQDSTLVRNTKGRRHDDYKKNIEVHPVALSIVAAVFTIIIGIAGYFFKGWAENITYEIRQFRLAAEKQMSETAANNEWKNGMSKWRDDVDMQLKDMDNRMDTLPWSVPQKGRRPMGPSTKQPATYGGDK